MAPTEQKEAPLTYDSTDIISKTTKVVGMTFVPKLDIFAIAPYKKLLEKRKNIARIKEDMHDIESIKSEFEIAKDN